MRANAGRSGMVWLFDLDNTLHDAGAFVFPALKLSMRGYIQQQLQVDEAEAQRLNLQLLAPLWRHPAGADAPPRRGRRALPARHPPPARAGAHGARPPA
jgi:FMN phosphatase YigB (HAD superfamily)